MLGLILIYRNRSIYVAFVTTIVAPTSLKTADGTWSQEWSEHSSTFDLCFPPGIHT